MQWVKTHLSLVITIAVGVLGISGLALGVVMSDVAERMAQDQSTFNTLTSTRGSNSEAIESARQHSEQILTRLEKGLKEFESIGSHAPILPEVLPKVNPGDASPYKFKGLYNEALKALLTRLEAVDQPSDREIQIEREAIQNAREREVRAEVMGRDPKAQARSRPAGPVNRSMAALPPGMQGFGGRAPTGRSLENLTPEQRAQEDERVRASIKKARSGRCYASLETFMLPALLGSNTAPSVEEMWYAQMMLWIEQDIVSALAAVNDAAARNLGADEKPWVGNMPIKHLRKIQIGNYVPPNTAAAPGGGGSAGGGGALQGGAATPPNSGSAVFTGRATGNGVDVIQFSLDVYLNPQYLPAVINEISKTGFYTPLLIEYQAESPWSELSGYVYGSQPLIHVIVLFEGCFLRSKYEKWIPQEIQLAINEGRANMGGAAGSGAPAPGRPMGGGLPRMMPGGAGGGRWPGGS